MLIGSIKPLRSTWAERAFAAAGCRFILRDLQVLLAVVGAALDARYLGDFRSCQRARYSPSPSSFVRQSKSKRSQQLQSWQFISVSAENGTGEHIPKVVKMPVIYWTIGYYVGLGGHPMMLTPIIKHGDEQLSVWLIMRVTDCGIVNWVGICSTVDMLIGTKNNSG